MKPYKVDRKRWNTFTPKLQLQHIAIELARATKASLRDNKEWRGGAYERAISLIDASIESPLWKRKKFLYQLRDATAALYVGKEDAAISNFIFTQLLLRYN